MTENQFLASIPPHFGRAIADASSVLLWISNAEKECIYFNSAWLKYRGRTLEEEFGFGWAEGVHKDDFDRCLKIYTKAFDSRVSFSMDYRLKKSDGNYGWIRDDGVPYYGDDGEFLGYVGSCFDITEKKLIIDKLERKKHDLLESNWRLTAAVKAAKIGIWDWNISNDSLLWNTEMYEIYGLDQSITEINFSIWESSVVPKDRDFAVKAINDSISERKPFDIEFSITQPNGLLRIIRSQADVIYNEQNQPIRMIGTNIDVTEARESEKRIVELEKRNQALLDYSPACHKIVDLDFNLIYLNKSAFKIHRLPSDARVIGQPYPFDFLPENVKKYMREQLALVKNTRKPISFEALECDYQGNELWLSHNIIPVFKDQSDELDYLTVVSSDMTEHKNAQELLKQKEKMEAIGQLAGGRCA